MTQPNMDQYRQLWGTLPQPRPSLTQENTPRWGITHIILTVILFFFSQALVIAGFMIAHITQNLTEFQNSTDQVGYALQSVANLGASPQLILVSALAMYASWLIGMKIVSKHLDTGHFTKNFRIKITTKDLVLGIIIAACFRALEQGVIWVLKTLNVNMGGAGNSESVTSQTGVWWVLNAVLVAAILAPIMEEFFFRGFVMQGIKNTLTRVTTLNTTGRTFAFTTQNNVHTSPLAPVEQKIEKLIQKTENGFTRAATPIAVILSSVFFGFMHWQGSETFGQWFVVIWTGLLGLVMAIMAVKTGRLGLSIAFHVTYNLSAILLVRFFGF